MEQCYKDFILHNRMDEKKELITVVVSGLMSCILRLSKTGGKERERDIG